MRGLCLFILLLSNTAFGKCLVHIVELGETLGKISDKYFETKGKWSDIKYWNKLNRNILEIGQKLRIYIPDWYDWKSACQYVLAKRMKQLRVSNRLDNFIDAIPAGVSFAYQNIKMGKPYIAFDLCRYAIATAEQESYFEFAIGGAGEAGPFQFKLSTVRLTLMLYNIKLGDMSDKTIVKNLLNEMWATYIFVLHYDYLLNRCSGNRYCAWKLYNNGRDKHIYAERALKRHDAIRKINPCKGK
jgi:LysM repeat protein